MGHRYPWVHLIFAYVLRDAKFIKLERTILVDFLVYNARMLLYIEHELFSHPVTVDIWRASIRFMSNQGGCYYLFGLTRIDALWYVHLMHMHILV